MQPVGGSSAAGGRCCGHCFADRFFVLLKVFVVEVKLKSALFSFRRADFVMSHPPILAGNLFYFMSQKF